MRKTTGLVVLVLFVCGTLISACTERRTRSIKIEGPERETEVKIETEEK